MKDQIFDHDISTIDIARLEPMIKSWATLNEHFLLDEISIIDIEKMIDIEHANRNREHLLKKLVGKWGTLKRKGVYEALEIK